MKNRLFLLTLLVVLLLAACSPTAPAEVPTEPVVPTDAPAEPAAEAVPTETSGAEPTQTEAMAEDPPAAPTAAPVVKEEPPAVTCEVASALHATDPSSVQLASGKVQLVEFFAFW